MNKFLDEKESKKVFEGGFTDYDWMEMVGYSRYAHKYFGWSAPKIEKEMRKIFSEKGINLVQLIDTMKSAISKRRFDFLELDSVNITIPEIEKIKQLKNRSYQKATLAVLIMAKHRGMLWSDKPALFGGRKEFGDIIRSKIAVYFNKTEFDDYSTYIGKEVGYISFHISKGDVGKWIVNFSEDGEIFKTINSFDNFKTILPFYCVKCKKEIPRGKYCSECR